MVKIIDMWIDKKGNLFFESYFDRNDKDKLKKFIEQELGYKVNFYEDKGREFKSYPAIWKKKVVRDINWGNYNNILYVINNRDDTDEQIVKGLGSEGSGFSITVQRGKIMTQYTKLLEAEGHKLADEQKIEVAKKIVNILMKGKRVNIQTSVVIASNNQKGKIIKYDKGNYEIELDDGTVATFKRNEFTLD